LELNTCANAHTDYLTELLKSEWRECLPPQEAAYYTHAIPSIKRRQPLVDREEET